MDQVFLRIVRGDEQANSHQTQTISIRRIFACWGIRSTDLPVANVTNRTLQNSANMPQSALVKVHESCQKRLHLFEQNSGQHLGA